MRDYEGRLVACGPDEFVFIVRDFTAQRRQARELERERDFSYAVVRSTPSFLALVDDDGTLLGVNRALETRRRPPGGDMARPAVLGALHRRRGRPARPGGLRTAAARRPAGRRRVRPRRGRRRAPRRRLDGDRRPRRRGPRSATSSAASTSPRGSTSRTRSAARARASSRRATPSGSASSATSTTAPSSTSSASRTPSTSASACSTRIRARAEEHFQRALVELNAAHEELRELARGLHPQILTVQGLAVAVRSLARPRADPRHRDHDRRRPALAAARRERRVLRRRRGADERRSSTRRRPRPRSACSRATTG